MFPCWNDLNGHLPENITAPHPSELPLPSAKLASPVQKVLQSTTGLKNEVEATSTTDENSSSHSGNLEAKNCKTSRSDENLTKSKLHMKLKDFKVFWGVPIFRN